MAVILLTSHHAPSRVFEARDVAARAQRLRAHIFGGGLVSGACAFGRARDAAGRFCKSAGKMRERT
eukprot:3449302-Pleurochrysis_carterae.AAC.2